MSNAIIGTGVLLKAGDGGSPENFVTIAEQVVLKPLQFSRNEIEVSTHNVGVEEKILGMLRQGQVTGTANWLPTDPTHDQILQDILANVKRNWRIAFPPLGLPHWTIPARVQLFDVQEITTDSPMQFAFALTVDGTVTMASS